MSVTWENEIEFPNGTTVGFWKLLPFMVNPDTKKAIAPFSGYFSQEKYAADPIGNKLMEQSVEIDFSSFDPGGALASGVAGLVQAAYAAKLAAEAAAKEQSGE